MATKVINIQVIMEVEEEEVVKGITKFTWHTLTGVKVDGVEVQEVDGGLYLVYEGPGSGFEILLDTRQP